VAPGASAIAPADGLPAALRGKQPQRRQRIVDAALELLREADDRNIHVREVAERAGVALGTVYRYMGSKDRLFAEAYQLWAADRFARARAAARGKTNTERLRRIALGFFDAFASEPQFLVLVRELAASPEPGVRPILDAVAGDFRSLCSDALEGIAPEDVVTISAIVIAVVSSALDHLMLPGSSVDRARRGVAIAVKTILEFRDPTIST